MENIPKVCKFGAAIPWALYWNSPAEVYYCVSGNHTFTDGVLQIWTSWLGIVKLAKLVSRVHEDDELYSHYMHK